MSQSETSVYKNFDDCLLLIYLFYFKFIIIKKRSRYGQWCISIISIVLTLRKNISLIYVYLKLSYMYIIFFNVMFMKLKYGINLYSAYIK